MDVRLVIAYEMERAEENHVRNLAIAFLCGLLSPD